MDCFGVLVTCLSLFCHIACWYCPSYFFPCCMDTSLMASGSSVHTYSTVQPQVQNTRSYTCMHSHALASVSCNHSHVVARFTLHCTLCTCMCVCNCEYTQLQLEAIRLSLAMLHVLVLLLFYLNVAGDHSCTSLDLCFLYRYLPQRLQEASG